MPAPGWLKITFRIVNVASIVALGLALILVLHKSPAPNVPNDPNAATRVEQKFAAADQAKASGQPAQVQMDSTELNSYLNQNLQLAGQPQASAPSSALPSDSQMGNAASPSATSSIAK